jgi:hypothetical protein
MKMSRTLPSAEGGGFCCCLFVLPIFNAYGIRKLRTAEGGGLVVDCWLYQYLMPTALINSGRSQIPLGIIYR